MDRLIAESGAKGSARAHLVSVFGSDQEIAAIAAALIETSWFNISGPGLTSMAVSLGEKAMVFRSSVSVPGRKRPLRHLVALSEEFGVRYTFGDKRARRTILCDDRPEFVVHRLSAQFGLPAVLEWSAWFAGELRKRGMVQPLVGFGCSPIAVQGTKKRLLALLSRGLKQKRINLPEEDSKLTWQPKSWFETRHDTENPAA